MKNFEQHLNEASLDDNQGIPDGLKSDIDMQASSQISKANREGKLRPPQELMTMMQKVSRIESRDTDFIESLAMSILKKHYGNIIDDINFDIKLSKPGQVVNDLKESDPDAGEFKSTQDEDESDDNSDDESRDDVQQDSEQESEESNYVIKDEVDKRKIINNLIQGNASKQHWLIYDEEAKSFIDEFDSELFSLYEKLMKSSEFMYWMMTIDMVRMVKDIPEALGGAVSVSFGKSEESGESGENESSEGENQFGFDEDEQDFAERILKDIENGGDLEDNADELGDVVNDMSITVHVRAVNLVLLLHEAVKGLYEVLASIAQPSDSSVAREVYDQTDTIEDEHEDLKYGKFLVERLNKFISDSDRINEIENLESFVFGEMMQLPTKDFLRLFHGIMSKTSEARNAIDSIIDRIIEEFREYNQSDDESDVDRLVKQSQKQEFEETENEEDDFSNMSRKEIDDLINKALDEEDYAMLDTLKPYIKENKTYKRFEMIQEAKNNFISYIGKNNIKGNVDSLFNNLIKKKSKKSNLINKLQESSKIKFDNSDKWFIKEIISKI